MTFFKIHLWKILTLVSIISLGLVRTIYIAEADILWQTKSGLDLLADGEFYRKDNYSWVVSGQEYISNSWLWNVILAVIYTSGGFLGMTVFTGLLVVLIFSQITYLLRKNDVPWPAVFATIAFVGVSCSLWFSSRPQIADYILLLLGMIIFHHVKLSSWTNHVLVFAAMWIITALWNNLHLTGPVGALIFSALYFLKQAEPFRTLKTDWRILIRSAVLAGLLLIFLLTACLATPYGVDGILKPLVTSSASSGLISEWLSPWSFNGLLNVLSAITIIFILPAILSMYKQKNMLPAVFLSGVLIIASWQTRWTPFLAILAVVFFARSAEKIARSIHSKYYVYIKTAAFATVAAAFMVGMVTFIPQDRVTNAEYGFSLASAVPNNCKVFNTPGIGASLIFARPDLKVSADGRNDLYGSDEYILQNNIAYSMPDAERWLDDNGIGCVLLKEDVPLNGTLSANNEWVLEKTDPRGSKLWVRHN